MDIAVFGVLIAGLIECSDIQSVIETVNADKNISAEIKTELVETLIKTTPECELNERSELSG